MNVAFSTEYSASHERYQRKKRSKVSHSSGIFKTESLTKDSEERQILFDVPRFLCHETTAKV